MEEKMTCCDTNKNRVIQKKMILVENLLKCATILTDMDDIDSRNMLLDIAEKYCNSAEQDYLDNLDSEVVSIIDDVRNSLSELKDGD